MKKKALFSGTFDPFTIGHYALVKRALCVADEIIIAVGINSGKKTFFSLEERMENIKNIYVKEKRVKIKSYDTLTIDFAKKSGVDFILRGIRNISDFEYEKNMADINYKLSGIETVFLFSEPEYGYVSSSLVRELINHKKDISNLIPTIK
ncbi:MAG: pantetheine-phosphate adenylyltransferase [Tannerella sp.]|jgi:pantetheine-phosphate adenylyltransferase|nr:pantetheine-phosphate adenylyltransferase [Tannerella sp.]